LNPQTRSSPSPLPSALPLGGPRWLYLDVLRGVAILLVVGIHTSFRLPDDAWGHRFFLAWRQIGWVGVDLFFVLSGFLIGGLLFAEHRNTGRIRYGRFFLRRTFKIWPTYLVFLAATFAYDLWDVPDRSEAMLSRLGHSASAIWPYIIHIQNYYESPLMEKIGHAWSLAVEEHFYLLLPVLLFALERWSTRRKIHNMTLARSPFRSLPWIGLGMAALCLGLRFNSWRLIPTFDFRHHWPTHLRMDSLFAGVTLAYATHFARPWIESLRSWRQAILTVSFGCFVPFIWLSTESSWTWTVGYTVLSVGSIGFVLVAWFASTAASTNLPTTAPLRSIARRCKNAIAIVLAAIGTRSYSIYLFHMPFSIPIVTKLQTHIGLWDSSFHYALIVAVYIAVAVAAGSFMYALVEAPSLALRDRLFPPASALNAYRPRTGIPVSPAAGKARSNQRAETAAV
jgi:peptidoglycan/LPS O-acetylase OafA/YrhL